MMLNSPVQHSAAMNNFSSIGKQLQSRELLNGVGLSRFCTTLEATLRSQSGEDMREFFDKWFQVLLSRIFGFETSAGWLRSNMAMSKEDAAALSRLLHPKGILFQTILKADKENLVKYTFPVNRLPYYTQMLTRSEAGLNELQQWPQYGGRMIAAAPGNVELRLSVFEYFVFWAGYYVLRAANSSTSQAAVPQASPIPHKPFMAVASWTDSQHGAARAPSFARLLQDYLHAFVPQPTSGANGGASSPSSFASSPSSASVQARVFLNTLVEFWLTDDDEPGPSKQQPSALRRNYRPPPSSVLQAVTALVRHITLAAGSEGGCATPVQCGVAWLPPIAVRLLLPMQDEAQQAQQLMLVPQSAASQRMMVSDLTTLLGAAGSDAFQTICLRLYRMLRRAFTLWPAADSSASLARMVDLWIAIMAPWRYGTAEQKSQQVSSSFHSVIDALHTSPKNKGGKHGGVQPYSGAWQHHVVATLPFYLLLLPLFVELICVRVSYLPDDCLEAAMKVLHVFGGEKELLQLLRDVEWQVWGSAATPAAVTPSNGGAGANRRGTAASHDVMLHLQPFAPLLAAQAQRWEMCAIATSSSSPPQQQQQQQPPLSINTPRLFGSDEASMVGLLLRMCTSFSKRIDARRMHELQAASDAVTSCIPGLGQVATVSAAPPPTPAAAVPTDRLLISKKRPADIKYSGEMLRRPVGKDECEWLVLNVLVPLSDKVNRKLQLGPYAPPPDREQTDNLWQLVLYQWRRGWWRLGWRSFSLRWMARWQFLGFVATVWLAWWCIAALLR